MSRRTPLHELHVELGGRLVDFAGYALPVQYPGGIIKEHLHTRAAASLFDVSHMRQIRVAGPRAAEQLEALIPADIVGLPAGRQRYGFFTNERGGMLDDLMIANHGTAYIVVANAARRDADLDHLQARLGGECSVEALDERALLALQGPSAAEVLGVLAPQVAQISFMEVRALPIAGTPCYVSRSGYTGEDGFEISVPATAALALARALLAHPSAAPAGLGARDSLRLEAGLCLYGHDIDETTSPVEADLLWAVARARRPGGARAGGYPGADVVERQLEAGVSRRRTALLPQSRLPVRAGQPLVDTDGNAVGIVTSGGFGPTLAAPVAMGYVAPSYTTTPGRELVADVRGNRVILQTAALPVVAHRYAR
jgi:glycine cleavage system T protein (aminomethyltransferase)